MKRVTSLARGWFIAPQADVAARLTLLGLVIALQNAIEFPRDAVTALLGKSITSLLVVLALAGSLALLVLALRGRLPRWRWLRSHRIQLLILLATLAAVPTGLHQIGAIVASGFQSPPLYPNDGTTLDHYAAQQLLEGHNPYVTVNIVSAACLYHQDAEHTTPLRVGSFSSLPPTGYPTKQQLRSLYTCDPTPTPTSVPELESHVSYPALAFLPLTPFVWAGLPSVVPFFGLCLLALVILLLISTPPEIRLWVGLLALADAPLLDATVAGDLDVFYILLLFVAWRWWRKPLLSTVFLGLAIAAKQLAWFFLPFYLILIWRQRGWRAALLRLAGSIAIFTAINGPFILNNIHAWLTGILAPQIDPMFPEGNGLIRLALIGVLPLAPSAVYTALEALGFLVALVWYWRSGWQLPIALGFVVPVLPLFLAWRSLSTYFYFVALPAAILFFVWQQDRKLSASNTARLSVSASPNARSLAIPTPTSGGATTLSHANAPLRTLPRRRRRRQGRR